MALSFVAHLANRVVAILLVAGIFVPAPSASAAPPAGTRPNVIVIVSDDLGYGDFGFQGGKDLLTPHLDSLAKGGVLFTNAYVTGPVCGPTRAGLNSGRYQQRHSYDSNPGPGAGLNLKESTSADAFHSGGYATGAIGKWHLGQEPEFRPLKRGFDEFFGFFGAMHSYIPGPVADGARMVGEQSRRGTQLPAREGVAAQGPEGKARGGVGGDDKSGKGGRGFGGKGFGGEPVKGSSPGVLIRGDDEVAEPGYLTEAFAREAVSFIDRHQNQPYFLYLCFNASHSPLQPPEKYLARFPNLTGKRQAYAATTAALDDAIGQVVAKLRELKQEENTLIYYTNDNGGPINDIAANNSPLGGAKGSLWEGGIRVPSFVNWKGHLPEGLQFNTPVISLDIFPTLVAAASLTAPSNKQFEGVNLLPALTRQADPGLKDRQLYWRFGQAWAIREGNWKLVKPERNEEVQLFNLEKDIAETTDLSKQQPEIVERLTSAWQKWNSENLPVATLGGR